MASSFPNDRLQIRNLLFEKALMGIQDIPTIASEWLVFDPDSGVKKLYHITLKKASIEGSTLSYEYKINIDDCSLNLTHDQRTNAVRHIATKKGAFECLYLTTDDFRDFNIGQVMLREASINGDTRSQRKSFSLPLRKVPAKEQQIEAIRNLDIRDAKIAKLFKDTLECYLREFIKRKQIEEEETFQTVSLSDPDLSERAGLLKREKRKCKLFCCFG